MPIGIVLLFLMAVAPVLPWRKASQRAVGDSTVLAGVVSVRVHSPSRVARRRRRLGPARRLRPRRVRRWRSDASARAGHPPAGLAGPRRPSQRRDDRPSRRDHDRRCARSVEQLHPLGHPRARAGRGRRMGRAHLRTASRSPTTSTTHESRMRGQRAARRRAGLPAGDHHLPQAWGRRSGPRAVRTGFTNDVYLTLEPGAEPGGDDAVDPRCSSSR